MSLGPACALRAGRSPVSVTTGWLAGAPTAIAGLALQPPAGRGDGWSGWLLYAIGLFLAGAILVAALPEYAGRLVATLRGELGRSALLGVLVGAVVLLVTALLAVSVIGIPLALVLGFAFSLAVFVGQAVAALALGEALIGQRAAGGRYLTLAVGALIVALLQVVPAIGWLLGLLLGLVGLGAMVPARLRSGRAAAA